MQAQAGALDDGNLSISGFGTLGVAKANTDQAQFARYNQAEGVADQAKIGLDTNLGLQATYKINDWLSGTAQILTRKNTSPTFTTDLTWAFLKARINDETGARRPRGAAGLPDFGLPERGLRQHHDAPTDRNVRQAPIEAGWRRHQLPARFRRLELHHPAFAGVSRGKLFVPAAATVATYRAPSAGLSVGGEYGPFSVRLAHARVKMTSNDLAPINTLTSTLAKVGFAQLGSDLSLIQGKKIAFTSIGGTMDWNNVVAQAELASAWPRTGLHSGHHPWYLMAGYRIGKVLPYFAHAAVRDAGHPSPRPPPSRKPAHWLRPWAACWLRPNRRTT
jgi:outer membrane protein W